jgi:high-affinity nickel-transport protein
MANLVAKIASKIPARLRLLPAAAVIVISALLVTNVIVWVAVAVVLRYEPSLAAPAVLSYTLGLRHALDADHISAIDLMTRRLIASGLRPVTVGMFFSLGHSTIVVITCLVVAATSGALEERFGGFQRIGGIIGTSVSAVVLLIGGGWSDGPNV